MGDDQPVEAIKRSLTIRYTLAIGIIFTLLLSSYFIITEQISRNAKSAYIINISGMQRMLSQRIAYLVHEIVEDMAEVEEKEEYLADLRQWVLRMEKNHSILTSGKSPEGEIIYVPSVAIQNAYFSGDPSLNEMVFEYIDVTRKFIDLAKVHQSTTPKIQVLYDQIEDMAFSEILQPLMEVVSVYQKENEENIGVFEKMELFVFIFGTFILILEITFIFRPMVQTIVRNITDLRAANEELQEFSYRISHDLKAPAVSSKGLADMALGALEKEDYKITEKALGHIKSTMLKLETLIDDILTLTRIRMDNVKYENVHMQELLEEITDKIKALAGYEKIEIRNDISVALSVVTDRFLLQQVLENLITNAIKYSDPDIEKPYVLIRAEEKGGLYCFYVEDNGIGVPEEYRENLFGMFKRFHPRVSFGSGLGLYMVKKNVEILGGAIEYIAKEKGSIFKFSLPKS